VHRAATARGDDPWTRWHMVSLGAFLVVDVNPDTGRIVSFAPLSHGPFVVRHIVDSDRIERSLAHMARRPASTSIRITCTAVI
jgi:hypothetical protein